MSFVFELLDSSRHDRAAFSCGEPPLDTYLKSQASQDVKRDLAVCYVLTESGSSTIVGYYTLSSCSVELTGLPREITKTAGRYRTVPGVLLGHLAVDNRCRGQGLGELLLLDALHHSLQAGIGIKLIIVDALHDTAATFYEHYGFRRFEDQPLRLYLPMAHVRTLFPADAAASTSQGDPGGQSHARTQSTPPTQGAPPAP